MRANNKKDFDNLPASLKKVKNEMNRIAVSNGKLIINN